ncbi:MAG TPA: penicillin-binding transpeptidase domain-containing protein [Verrucomicrobiota bacterium]|nr:penicillin-binding transpeptidase domain-containing protein [Verrucomicrobiota bacterium]HNU49598.1 penicillin-binding transpeptidase domain-containing protein [Verrucomicrobiota bacterium]
MLILDQLRKGEQRLRAVAVVLAAGMLVLLAGLWYVQIVSARHYQASLLNQTYRTVRIPATRGKILDRNGLVLAENRPSYNLNLYLEELRPQFEKEFTRARAGRRLTRAERERLSVQVRSAVVSNALQQAAVFFGQPVAVTDRDYRRHHRQWPYRPLPILENLSALQIARFLEQAPAWPGMDLEVQPVRFYPQSNRVAHVLGYLTRDDLARDDEEGGFSYSLPSYDGAVGVEYAFNDLLKGRAGVKSVAVNSLCYRDSEEVWATAQPGQNVVLSLDLPLQRAAFEALRRVGPAVRGAAVVMDAVHGDVLALVSMPAYDPNEFVRPLPPERWALLNDDQQRPMFNRATQGAYNPGSTFKIVTALAALGAGLDPEESYTVQPDPARPGRGAIRVGRRKIEDTVPPGDYDFVRAFKRSSNSYFIHHGLRAGRDRVLGMGRRFFLGERIGLPTRQESSGVFPRPEDVVGVWNEGNVANACIGQEITATPLQMAVLTAAVANGGRVLRPRLVQRWEPAEPSAETSAAAGDLPQVRGDLQVPARHLELIRDAMLADTEEPEGTGYLAFQQVNPGTGRREPRLPGFRVCGKTGTAQITKGGRVVDHVTWFVSFGPYDSPRYVVVVVVEGGGSGGLTCAPVARQIYEAIQQRLRGSSRPGPGLAALD